MATKSLTFLIHNTDYPDFLRWLCIQHPGLAKQPYEKQMRLSNGSLFVVTTYYFNNLRRLGREVWDIHVC
jgi:hypothetical protein